MRPPRVFQSNGKLFIEHGNKYFQIVTKGLDIPKIQHILTKNIQITKKGKGCRQKNENIKEIVGMGDLESDKLGLTDVEIDRVMKDAGAFEYGYQGCISADQLDKIKPTKEPFSFIINTDPSNLPGQHWIAVYIDPTVEKEVNVFDSYGEEPDVNTEFGKTFMSGIKTMIDKLKLPYMLKFKVNLIPQQHVNTDTCGFHAMKFIIKRIQGESFKDATGYNDLESIVDLKEQQINKLKKELKEFGYV